MDPPHQSMGYCLPLAAQLRAAAFLPPPSPKPSCTPAGHRRLLALHPAGALLVQRETSFDVSKLLLPCAWGERNFLVDFDSGQRSIE